MHIWALTVCLYICHMEISIAASDRCVTVPPGASHNLNLWGWGGRFWFRFFTEFCFSCVGWHSSHSAYHANAWDEASLIFTQSQVTALKIPTPCTFLELDVGCVECLNPTIKKNLNNVEVTKLINIKIKLHRKIVFRRQGWGQWKQNQNLNQGCEDHLWFPNSCGGNSAAGCCTVAYH